MSCLTVFIDISHTYIDTLTAGSMTQRYDENFAALEKIYQQPDKKRCEPIKIQIWYGHNQDVYYARTIVEAFVSVSQYYATFYALFCIEYQILALIYDHTNKNWYIRRYV